MKYNYFSEWKTITIVDGISTFNTLPGAWGMANCHIQSWLYILVTIMNNQVYSK